MICGIHHYSIKYVFIFVFVLKTGDFNAKQKSHIEMRSKYIQNLLGPSIHVYA